MNFLSLFLLEKKDQKVRSRNSGPKFGRSKFVSQNSASNSGSGGARSSVQKFVSEHELHHVGLQVVKSPRIED